jgi:hypothetical protein
MEKTNIIRKPRKQEGELSTVPGFLASLEISLRLYASLV